MCVHCHCIAKISSYEGLWFDLICFVFALVDLPLLLSCFLICRVWFAFSCLFYCILFFRCFCKCNCKFVISKLVFSVLSFYDRNWWLLEDSLFTVYTLLTVHLTINSWIFFFFYITIFIYLIFELAVVVLVLWFAVLVFRSCVFST